ncbi:MAG: flippase-like domain-containing protein [Solirubrobacteraceae bacterium]|nr:flippase-like domain-containing protein [Solirubrobacteraceae bacterium]
MLTRIAFFALTGISLYLLAPTLLQVFSSYDELDRIAPWWLAVMVLLQVGSFACLWGLQRIAINNRDWFVVIWSQLAGNAFARVVPGGGAAGAALQYRYLNRAGTPTGIAVTGLTASNVLVFAVLLALPVFAVPSLLSGVSADASLIRAAVGGLVLLVVMFAVGVVLLAFDRPLEVVGEVVQRIRNRMRRRRPPRTDIPARLIEERELILHVMGRRWWEALLAAIGRWLLDYATLLAALAAIGARPAPALILLAFVTAQILAQIPLTPGGLGFVEAGLTGTLALAGVTGGGAVLTTLAYRLVSYWLPIPFGVVGAVLLSRRYGGDAEEDAEEAVEATT